MKQKYKYDGKEYDRLEEMPEDVRELFEKNGEPSAGLEEEYEEELRGEGENLLETEKSLEKDEHGLEEPAKSCGTWRMGVVFVGLVLISFGVALLAGQARSHRGVLSILGWVGLSLLVSGTGLILRQAWSRIMTLCGLPVLLLFAIPLYARPLPVYFRHGLLAFIMFSAAAFVFLLLPRVAREFRRKARTLKPRMRIAKLAPPPRTVPFSLKLSLVWGSHAGLLFSMMMGFICLPIGMQLKPVLAGVNLLQDPVFLLLLLIPLALVAAFAVAARFVMKAGMLDIKLLENGCLTFAKVTKKVKISAGEDIVYRLYYEYDVNGKVYKSWDDYMFLMSRLEDEASEPVIYAPTKPSRAMLLDSLPAHISVDSRGNWVHRFAFMGYVYLVPLLVILAAAYLALK